MSQKREVGRLKAVGVLCCLIAFTNVACYNSYFISKTQLEKLESRAEQRQAVAVIIDGCDMTTGGAAPATSELVGPMLAQEGEGASDGGEAKAAAEPKDENIDPETGCPIVKVNTASPLRVVTTEGQNFRVTPFNFAVTDTQLVSPDYDLLLPIDNVEGAEVETFSGMKTGLMIGGGVVAAVATFVLIALNAEDDRGFGQ